jgi:hypothetical protein
MDSTGGVAPWLKQDVAMGRIIYVWFVHYISQNNLCYVLVAWVPLEQDCVNLYQMECDCDILTLNLWMLLFWFVYLRMN